MEETGWPDEEDRMEPGMQIDGIGEEKINGRECQEMPAGESLPAPALTAAICSSNIMAHPLDRWETG